MDNKTHQQLVCARITNEVSTMIVGLIVGWRGQAARQMFEEALAAVIPVDVELSPGELEIVKGLRAKFNFEVATDVAFEAQARQQAEMLAMDIMNQTGARELFGLVEDIVHGKSSAKGKQLLERAQRLHDVLHPEDMSCR